MNELREIVNRCQQRGIRLSLGLRVEGWSKAPADLQEDIRHHKQEILALLRSQEAGPFLELVDDLWYALTGMPKDNPYRAGLEQILNKQVKAICDHFRLELILPKESDDFTPELHEAVGITRGPEDKVVSVQQLGFRYRGGQVFRPARVIIGDGANSLATDRCTAWGIPIPDGWDASDPVFQRHPLECDCFRAGVLRCSVPCVWAWPPGARPGDKAMKLRT